MLYHLLFSLSDEIAAFNVFRYITFRTGGAIFTALIFVMLGLGLNIVVGLAGLLDLGYVAFYAVGAYSYALLNYHFGLGFWTVKGAALHPKTQSAGAVAFARAGLRDFGCRFGVM